MPYGGALWNLVVKKRSTSWVSLPTLFPTSRTRFPMLFPTFLLMSVSSSGPSSFWQSSWLAQYWLESSFTLPPSFWLLHLTFQFLTWYWNPSCSVNLLDQWLGSSSVVLLAGLYLSFLSRKSKKPMFKATGNSLSPIELFLWLGDC